MFKEWFNNSAQWWSTPVLHRKEYVYVCDGGSDDFFAK